MILLKRANIPLALFFKTTTHKKYKANTRVNPKSKRNQEKTKSHRKASKELDFMLAAKLRDEIKALQEKI